MISVTMMMAVTLDGKIAKDSAQLADWTSKEDKKIFAEISKTHGVVMMGENTFNTFPAPLKDRLNVVFTQQKNKPITDGVKWVEGEPEKVLIDLEGLQISLIGWRLILKLSFFRKEID